MKQNKLFEIDGRNGIWSVPSWCAQVGISEPTYYALDPQPHRVKLGRIARITESPRDYAERIRRAQRVCGGYLRGAARREAEGRSHE